MEDSTAAPAVDDAKVLDPRGFFHPITAVQRALDTLSWALGEEEHRSRVTAAEIEEAFGTLGAFVRQHEAPRNSPPRARDAATLVSRLKEARDWFRTDHAEHGDYLLGKIIDGLEKGGAAGPG